MAWQIKAFAVHAWEWVQILRASELGVVMNVSIILAYRGREVETRDHWATSLTLGWEMGPDSRKYIYRVIYTFGHAHTYTYTFMHTRTEAQKAVVLGNSLNLGQFPGRVVTWYVHSQHWKRKRKKPSYTISKQVVTGVGWGATVSLSLLWSAAQSKETAEALWPKNLLGTKTSGF